jgi:hypothetical protein
MAAPLSLCIKEEQRSVNQFFLSEGVSGATIHKRLSAQYGNTALAQWSVYEWIEKLKFILFLDRIITGNKTWIHQHSMKWKHPHLLSRNKFKSQPSAGKLTLTVFGTQKGQYWNVIRRGAQQ